MENINQNLTKRIMRRIYAIWFLKRVAPALTAMPLSLGLALWLMAKEFFVAKIVENFIISFHEGGIPVLNFFGSAIYHAPLLPAATIGFFGVLFLVLGYRLFRNLRPMTLVRI